MRRTDRTPQWLRARIEQTIIDRVQARGEGGASAIEQRLEALDRAWHLDRAALAQAVALGALGLALGALVDRRWYLLAAAGAFFLGQRALFGWSISDELMRRAGMLTRDEVRLERELLQALRDRPLAHEVD